MNHKLPPGVNPPAFPSVQNGFGCEVIRVMNDPRFDPDQAMAAYMELQRPLIEERRRLAQAERPEQTV